MPVEVGIWRINDGVAKVHFSPIGHESKLETVLSHDIGLLDPNLMVIGRRISTAYGKLIDLLAIDAQGDLTVVELRKGEWQTTSPLQQEMDILPKWHLAPPCSNHHAASS